MLGFFVSSAIYVAIPQYFFYIVKYYNVYGVLFINVLVPAISQEMFAKQIKHNHKLCDHEFVSDSLSALV